MYLSKNLSLFHALTSVRLFLLPQGYRLEVKKCLILLLLALPFPAFPQGLFTGSVVDSTTQVPLAHVNIGIRQKNVGTISLTDGSFSIQIAEENRRDTLTFSLVGYGSVEVPIPLLRATEPFIIRLSQKTVQLSEVKITAAKLVEKKYGIKRRNPLLHFTDGMFINATHDSYEIGQLIRLDNRPTRITSVNLHLNAPRKDSASFRINFYRYDEERPTSRMIESSIIQRHPIREGWLKFDLRDYHITLKGNVIAAIEFLPEPKKDLRPISYEVKLGGASRSFYRKSSLGMWNRPPHHYCLYVTALVDKQTPEEAEDTETPPSATLRSTAVKDSFSLFIHLPKSYHRDASQRYPVIYLLDGNAYFDEVKHSTGRFAKKKKLAIEPILVGIGYGNAYLMDSLRVRDYTFPPAPASDSLPLSGGGENFYRFIQRELIPHIDRQYRTDTTQRTLMGHSFGGYFVLYALLKDQTDKPLFAHYVAASPSIDYGDGYLMQRLEQLIAGKEGNALPGLYLTAGEIELAEDPGNRFSHFIRLLESKAFMRLKTKTFKNTEHMGTAIPSFEEGLRFTQEK
jgi:predicted alpha/beta superfamily hydrolase